MDDLAKQIDHWNYWSILIQWVGGVTGVITALCAFALLYIGPQIQRLNDENEKRNSEIAAIELRKRDAEIEKLKHPTEIIVHPTSPNENPVYIKGGMVGWGPSAAEVAAKNKEIDNRCNALLTLLNSGKYVEVLQDAEKLIATYPNEGAGYFFRGASRLNLDITNTDDVEADMRKAISLAGTSNGVNGFSHWTLAFIANKRQDTKALREHLNKTLEHIPEHEAARATLRQLDELEKNRPAPNAPNASKPHP